MTRGWAVVVAAVLAALPGGAGAESGRSLRVVLDGATAVVPGELPLFFDQRLTFVLPDTVRMAVAGSPDVLVTHIKDNVVAVSLIDSEYVRQIKPLTNLTIIMNDGAAVTARVTVAASAGEVAVDLVDVERGAGFDSAVRAQATQLIATWLSAGPEELDERLATRLRHLDPLVNRRARRELARWVAAGGVTVLDETHRTKRAFIYLTSRSLTRLGEMVVAHVEVTNHSQEPFVIDRVVLWSGGKQIGRAHV